MDRPVGVAEHFARHEDEVGLALVDDAVGLGGLGDHADGGGGDGGFVADASREVDLIAGREGNFGVGDVAAGRAVDQVNAVFAQEAGKLNRVVDGPAAFRPVASGDADKQGQMGGPDTAHFIDNLEKETGAVFKTAAVGVGALVGERRVELVEQVAVGGVNFDQVEAGGEGRRWAA